MKPVLYLMLFWALRVCAAPYWAPTDIIKSGDLLYISTKEGRHVLAVRPDTLEIAARIEAPIELSGLVASADGSRLYATGGGYAGELLELDPAAGTVTRRLRVGHTPVASVLSPDGATLYVCNQFNDDVVMVDLEKWAVTDRVKVDREPVAADISPDGKWLFVANLIPSGRSDADYVACEISVVNTETKEVTAIPLVNGAEGVHGLKVAPDGEHVFVTHFMARYQVPTTQLERGWVSTDALSVIRIADLSLKHTVLLDDVSRGFPNPWAIGFSGDGETLVVSAAASHELSLIDLPALMDHVEAKAKTRSGEARLDAHNDLAFLSGLRTRVKLEGKGPRALVVEGDTAFVAHYYSDSIDKVAIAPRQKARVTSKVLNPNLHISQTRLGEIYFHDAQLCFQQWLSCSTCHPGARTDGMNWDLLNDGMGNPKNVKSMLLAHRTPKTTWLGVRDNAEVSVRAGIKHIQFAVRPEEDAVAIDTYLKSLRPTPSPHLVDGELGAAALRGKTLFKQAGCASCHPAPLFTDLQNHEVGTTKGVDLGKPVNTPSLIELWRTGPYLHDGRAATVHELLRGEDHAGIFSGTAALSEEELLDLETYLLSL